MNSFSAANEKLRRLATISMKKSLLSEFVIVILCFQIFIYPKLDVDVELHDFAEPPRDHLTDVLDFAELYTLEILLLDHANILTGVYVPHALLRSSSFL